MDALKDARLIDLRAGRKVRLLHATASAAKLNALLVHGAAASMDQYNDLIDALLARGDTSVLAWDWLGCGGSPKPRDRAAYSTPELIADVEAALRMLTNVERPRGGSAAVPTVIIAHSFGCSLVTALLAAKPELQPSALILMSTSDGEAVLAKLGIFILPEFALNLVQPAMSASFRKMAFHPSTPHGIAMRAEMISARNEMHMCKAFYRQMDWAQPEAAAATRCPVLALHGEEDLVISHADGLRWHEQFSGSSQKLFVTIEQASHMLMLERPARVHALISAVADNLVLKRPDIFHSVIA